MEKNFCKNKNGENMKKIGIISLYYKNNNFGGMLQAYALCKTLNNAGYEAEQIRFVYLRDKNEHRSIKDMTFGEIISKVFSKTVGVCYNTIKKKIYNIYSSKFKKEVDKNVQLLSEQFERFRDDKVPQSKIIYTKETITETLKRYDVFIAGSDQVWNPLSSNPIKRLNFVPSEKIKMSYAASVSTNVLRKDQIEIFKNSLADYDGVSVREDNTVELFKEIGIDKTVLSLDPTLLLSNNDWDEICDKRIIKEPYIFCYFLGQSKQQRMLANEFAKKHGLKIVAIPCLMKKYNKWDNKYTDIFIEGASPEAFISLIKHANYVFTDSFHASVFSIIYSKQFFVFNRCEYSAMNIRIYSLLNIFNIKERMCDNKEKMSINYLDNHCKEYQSITPEFIELKNESLNYLFSTINTGKGKTR